MTSNAGRFGRRIIPSMSVFPTITGSFEQGLPKSSSSMTGYHVTPCSATGFAGRINFCPALETLHFCVWERLAVYINDAKENIVGNGEEIVAEITARIFPSLIKICSVKLVPKIRTMRVHHCIGMVMKMCHLFIAILPFMVVAAVIIQPVVVNETELVSEFMRQRPFGIITPIVAEISAFQFLIAVSPYPASLMIAYSILLPYRVLCSIQR